LFLPSEALSTILARNTCCCGLLWRLTINSRPSRADGLNSIRVGCGPRHLLTLPSLCSANDSRCCYYTIGLFRPTCTSFRDQL
jgi:hypothetical protein